MSDSNKILSANSISSEILSQITEMEETVKSEFKKGLDIELDNDEEAIRYLDGFIERNKDGLEAEAIEQWVNYIGSFLGQTIIKVYGGEWVETSEIGLQIRENIVCHPFSKVAKQFLNGKEDSIHHFFSFIPQITDEELSINQFP